MENERELMYVDILCIGNTCGDLAYIMPRYPDEAEKLKAIQSSMLFCGGPAATAAAVGAKYGAKTALISIVGNDFFGKYLIDILNEQGIITFVEKYLPSVLTNELDRYKIFTSLSTVAVSEKTGERTIFSGYRDPKMIITGDYSFIKPRGILTDGLLLEESLKAIRNNQESVSVLDAGIVKDENIILGKEVDFLICSQDFAERFVEKETNRERKTFFLNSSATISEAYEVMSTVFPKNIIITLGKEGSVYRDESKILLVPTLNLKELGLGIVDTTGAGDIFHGAFLEGILKIKRPKHSISKSDIETALRYASTVAALSTTKLGGITSIPSLEQVKKYYKILENTETIILNSYNKELIR